jgi:hypothetical protein
MQMRIGPLAGTGISTRVSQLFFSNQVEVAPPKVRTRNAPLRCFRPTTLTRIAGVLPAAQRAAYGPRIGPWPCADTGAAAMISAATERREKLVMRSAVAPSRGAIRANVRCDRPPKDATSGDVDRSPPLLRELRTTVGPKQEMPCNRQCGRTVEIWHSVALRMVGADGFEPPTYSV